MQLPHFPVMTKRIRNNNQKCATMVGKNSFERHKRATNRRRSPNRSTVTAGADGAVKIDVADGASGVDGNLTCLARHSSDSVIAAQQQFSGSQRSSGAVAVDCAGGRAGAKSGDDAAR